MKPEERARYERQIEDSNSKLVEIGKRHLQLQALLISNPDPVPKRHYTKKRAHGKADARGLTAAELADRALAARERAERAGRVETPEESDDESLMLIPGTPPRQIAGESQGGTTITIDLPIRTPERPRVATPPPRAPSPLPLASTAPPTLGGSLGKRKRTITAKYKQGREEGLNLSIGYS
jgi:hypothetical protein